jgi:hypothetical protein
MKHDVVTRGRIGGGSVLVCRVCGKREADSGEECGTANARALVLDAIEALLEGMKSPHWMKPDAQRIDELLAALREVKR